MTSTRQVFELARRDFVQRAKSRAFLMTMVLTVGLVLLIGPLLMLLLFGCWLGVQQLWRRVFGLPGVDVQVAQRGQLAGELGGEVGVQVGREVAQRGMQGQALLVGRQEHGPDGGAADVGIGGRRRVRSR